MFYIRAYLLSLLIAAVLYIGGNHFFAPKPLCANSLTCKSDLSLHIDNTMTAFFEGKKITPPKMDLLAQARQSNVLGATTPNGEKHVYVNLATQTLYAFQGKAEIMKTYIASGKWGKTPIGNFHVWEKLVATRMAGGEGADAYDLPNVPYVMYFYNDFGLHGAYWHNNFGHTMSHGCVNMRIADAKKLFGWVDVGTPVSVCSSFTDGNTCVQDNPIE